MKTNAELFSMYAFGNTDEENVGRFSEASMEYSVDELNEIFEGYFFDDEGVKGGGEFYDGHNCTLESDTTSNGVRIKYERSGNSMRGFDLDWVEIYEIAPVSEILSDLNSKLDILKTKSFTEDNKKELTDLMKEMLEVAEDL